jgi:methylmalonyl-CoA mutase N-terminal domain/subunit
MGGTLAAIEQGFIQREIQDSAYRAQQAVDSGAAVVVGLNRFADGDARSVPTFNVDPDVERRQVERVRALRATRSVSAWSAALSGVEEAARSGANLVPRIIDAVEASATVGEIADTLRAVFGVYQEIATV